MSDLIKREDAIDALAEAMPSLTTPDGCGEFDRDIQIADEAFVDAMQIINDLPSADRPQGEWKPFDLTWGRSIYYCTECKEGIEVPTSCGKPMYKFCPMCGARMDTADTPQTDCLIVDARFKAHCLNCAESGSYKCTKCDGEMYYKDIPQTDLVKDSDDLVKDLVKDTPQTESTGSPIGDYRDGVGAWQTERMTEEEIDTMLAKALVGQTDCGWGKPTTVGSDEDKEV